MPVDQLRKCINGNGSSDNNTSNIESHPLVGVLQKSTLLLIHHANAEHLMPIIDMVLANLDSQLESPKLDEIKTAVLLSILNVMVTVRKGKRVKGNWLFRLFTFLQYLL